MPLITPLSIRYAGLTLLIVGLGFGVLFASTVHFNPNPQVWFTSEYYIQFIPLYIAVTLLLCGLFIVTEFSQVNLYLAVFGHATSEEIFFSMIGLTSTPLPQYAVYLFFPLSLVALWVAYANTLKKKPVSVGEAIFGIVFSTAFILLPRYL